MIRIVAEQCKAGDSAAWALEAACGRLLVEWTAQNIPGAELWAEDAAPYLAAGIPARDLYREADAFFTGEGPLLILPAALPLFTQQVGQELMEHTLSFGRAVRMGEAVCYPQRELPALKARFMEQGVQVLWQPQAQDEFADPDGIAQRVSNARGLMEAISRLQKRIVERHIQNDVILLCPDQVQIDADVVIEPGARIHPNVLLEGNSYIGRGSVLYPGCQLKNACIGAHVTVRHSVLEDCTVGDHTTVGPFAMLRGGAVIGQHVRIGDFVEVKNASLGDRACAAHLAYIGDASVGKDVNIGCGVVFCNYDGKDKHHTDIGDGAFIGSNANLVAPLRVGAGAFVAAGSTVTQDVEADALYISRPTPVIKEGWAAKRRNR